MIKQRTSVDAYSEPDENIQFSFSGYIIVKVRGKTYANICGTIMMFFTYLKVSLMFDVNICVGKAGPCKKGQEFHINSSVSSARDVHFWTLLMLVSLYLVICYLNFFFFLDFFICLFCKAYWIK